MTDSLQDVKDVFNRLQKKRLGPRYVHRLVGDDRIIDDWAKHHGEDDGHHDEDDKLWLAMVKAAKVYVIARDHGVHEAVIWKLRNG